MIAAKEWNPQQEKLGTLLQNSNQDGLELCISMHSSLHSGKVSENNQPTYFDLLSNELNGEMITFIDEKMKHSIAWHLWHITRIEDIIANILIADSSQILDKKWIKKLNCSIIDTGNAMSKEDMVRFNKEINPDVLLEYRNTVGAGTNKILKQLTASDIKTKVERKRIERIFSEGGIVEAESSYWLLDFWARKNIGGLLTMPFTRHQVVHLNKCFKITTVLKKNKC